MDPFERLKKYNTIENLWLYILSLAEKEPVYGYRLRALIFKNFNFKPGRITSYRVLYRLEDGGFIK
jgi:DNA-binding PadR family transcriptional regulator